MEEALIKSFMELGTTGAFLVYLYIRNGKQEKAMGQISESLEKNNNALDRHTKVLIKVATKHGLLDEADQLISE